MKILTKPLKAGIPFMGVTNMDNQQFNSYTSNGITIKKGTVITSPNGHTWEVIELKCDYITFDANGKQIPVHILDIQQLINLGYTIKE